MEKLCIGFVKDKVDSNPKYFPIPSQIDVSDPPANLLSHWMSYSPKEFYPIALFRLPADANEEKYKNSVNLLPEKDKISIQATLDVQISCSFDGQDSSSSASNESTPDKCVIKAPHQKGIYWIQALRIHQQGTISIDANVSSSKYEVLPLHLEIAAFGDHVFLDSNKQFENDNEVVGSHCDTDMSSNEVSPKKKSLKKDNLRQSCSNSVKAESTCEEIKEDHKDQEDAIVDNNNTVKRRRRSSRTSIDDSIDQVFKQPKIDDSENLVLDNLLEIQCPSSPVVQKGRPRGRPPLHSAKVAEVVTTPAASSNWTCYLVYPLSVACGILYSLEKNERCSALENFWNQHKEQFDSAHVDPINSCDIVLFTSLYLSYSFPNHFSLSKQSMIARPLDTKELLKPNTDCNDESLLKILCGSSLTLRLPPSLVLSLKDDQIRCRQFLDARKHFQVLHAGYQDDLQSLRSHSSPCQFKAELDYLERNSPMVTPCVKEILYRVKSKMENSKPSMKEELELHFHQLCLLFDALCAVGSPLLFYPDEFPLIKFPFDHNDRFFVFPSHLNIKKLKYSDILGPVFLLRFIVALVMEMDVPTDLSSTVVNSKIETASEPSDYSPEQNHSLQDSLFSSTCLDSEPASLSPSQQRRNSVLIKNLQMELSQLQDILNEIVQDLDELSPFLF